MEELKYQSYSEIISWFQENCKRLDMDNAYEELLAELKARRQKPDEAPVQYVSMQVDIDVLQVTSDRGRPDIARNTQRYNYGRIRYGDAIHLGL